MGRPKWWKNGDEHNLKSHHSHRQHHSIIGWLLAAGCWLLASSLQYCRSKDSVIMRHQLELILRALGAREIGGNRCLAKNNGKHCFIMFWRAFKMFFSATLSVMALTSWTVCLRKALERTAIGIHCSLSQKH